MTYMGIAQEVLKEGLIKLVAQEVLLFSPPYMPAARLGKTVLSPRLALPLLGKMPVFLRPVHPPTPLPSQPTALLPSPEDRGPPNLPNTQTGQANNPTNYPRQGSRQPPKAKAPPGLPGGSYYLPGRQ